MKSGLFDYGQVRTEINYKIKELALKKKLAAQ